MQISRLFEIVYILLNRRHVTARMLAERFEVSVRTIYRDIEALSQAGVPVYATQGAHGGIFISDAYVLNKSALTDYEQGQILLALQSLSATGHSDSDQLLSRLGSLFNKDSADWIEVDFSRWGNESSDREALARLKDAILGRRLLTFTYYSGGGVRTQRTVSPIRLMYKSRAWYVHAFCHTREDYRTFKIVRMTNVAVLEETFDLSALPELVAHPDTGEGEQASTPTVQAVLRFDTNIAWRVLDEFSPTMIRWEPDGRLTLTACMPLDDWTYRNLLSYGSSLEVLGPPTLRAAMREELALLCAKYEDA